MTLADLVLASASPRRRQLLSQLGLKFRTCESGVDEAAAACSGASPERLVRELALAKALAVAARERDALVLAADTVVVLGGEVMGKPRDAGEAEEMLARLQGREHRVLTGLALLDAASGRSETAVEETRVRLRPLAAEEIRAYVATGEPLDKAGAYAIQGLGALLVTGIQGCYYNVVGLPLARLGELLRRFGVDVWKAVGRR